MKTIGLIGGTSWVSTIDYYRYINEGINAKLGGIQFAKCIIHSFNFAEIQRNNDANDWDNTLMMFTNAAQNLERSGAGAILICANTLHRIAEPLQEKIGIPIIHIGVATADAIAKKGLTKIGLLGTRFTMELDFIKQKLKNRGIDTLIPDEQDRNYINKNISGELAKNIFTEESKQRYLAIIHQLIMAGAEGIVLGCTEIPMLIKPADVAVPIFDTAAIHATAAVEFALS
jgi:aspartate racemase